MITENLHRGSGYRLQCMMEHELYREMGWGREWKVKCRMGFGMRHGMRHAMEHGMNREMLLGMKHGMNREMLQEMDVGANDALSLGPNPKLLRQLYREMRHRPRRLEDMGEIVFFDTLTSAGSPFPLLSNV